MNKNIKIEQQDVVVHQFVVSDGDKKIPAGELLSALIVLTDSHNVNGNNITEDKSVRKYLNDHNLVEELSDNKFKINEDKRQECVDLGNEISKNIDKQLSELPENASIRIPSIFINSKHISK